MTATGLAEKVGVSKNTVTNWTTGRYRPSGRHAGQLAAALDASVDAFLTATTAAVVVSTEAPTAAPGPEQIVIKLARLDSGPATDAVVSLAEELAALLQEAQRFVAEQPS